MSGAIIKAKFIYIELPQNDLSTTLKGMMQAKKKKTTAISMTTTCLRDRMTAGLSAVAVATTCCSDMAATVGQGDGPRLSFDSPCCCSVAIVPAVVATELPPLLPAAADTVTAFVTWSAAGLPWL